MYMAPEVLTKSKYSEKADVFSFGVLLVELFTGRAPYNWGGHAVGLASEIAKGARPDITGLAPEVESICKDCWMSMARMRPDMSEVVRRLERVMVEYDVSESSSDTESGVLSTPSKSVSEDGASVPGGLEVGEGELVEFASTGRDVIVE